jgi:hypothetical protein
MGRPKYTRQDDNQRDIEVQLQELGFMTLRTSNSSVDGYSGAHYLDLFVLGMHRKFNAPIWSQWEVKVSKESEFTESEMHWLSHSQYLFGSDVPVLVAYSVDDILKWYGWT